MWVPHRCVGRYHLGLEQQEELCLKKWDGCFNCTQAAGQRTAMEGGTWQT